jgi:hypothetical protein
MSKLSKSAEKTAVAGVETFLYIMPNVTLTFRVNGGRKPFEHFMEKVEVLPQPPEIKEISIPSILGRDFLNKYTLIIIRGEIIWITDEDIKQGLSGHSGK